MDKEFSERLLTLIERDSRLTHAELASALNCSVSAVDECVQQLEDDQIICGYHTLVNWDKVHSDAVTALVELRVTPQGRYGYNQIAERIYQYPQVETLYLMSGAYDFLVVLREKNIKDVSLFVSENLASMEEVQGTTTYFTLIKYKENGFLFTTPKNDKRMVVTP